VATGEEDVMSQQVSARWLRSPVLGLPGVAVGDVLFALVLCVFSVASAAGVSGSNAHNANAGWAASLAVLLMVAPVVAARRYPVAVAAVLAAGAALNWVAIGHLARCGTGLPAVFYVAFVIGARCRWRPAVVGLALLAGNVVCQAYSDPLLGSGVLVYMVPITVAFAGAGRLLAARNAAVARLRVRTAQLRAQREENARLAVAADQSRIAADLDGVLQRGVEQIATAAASGRDVLAAQPEDAQAAFMAIQETGRATLTHMREVVANLTDPAPTEPAPMLAHLDRLLAGASEAQTRLQVSGDPRLLPPGLELSGYRIIERLLLAVDSDPAARVEVTVTFGAQELELTVDGPSARRAEARADVAAALAAATERAAVHGGTLATSTSGGRRTTVVRLPLAAGHV
jgi:hypothetical protein